MNPDEEAKQLEKSLASSIELILDRDKKRKARFAAILDVIFKQIATQSPPGSSSHPSTSSSSSESFQNSKNLWIAHQPWKANSSDSIKRRLENTWKDCVRKEYDEILSIILDSLIKISSGFFSKIINSSQLCKDILRALTAFLSVLEFLEPFGIRELMEGVFRNSILHIVFCCIDYTNKHEARIIGTRILAKIIISYDVQMFTKLQEQSIVDLFSLLVDFNSLVRSNNTPTTQSIKHYASFNCPGNAMPAWASYIKDSAPIDESIFFKELCEFISNEGKHARKFMLIVRHTWLRKCSPGLFDADWTDDYFINKKKNQQFSGNGGATGPLPSTQLVYLKQGVDLQASVTQMLQNSIFNLFDTFITHMSEWKVNYEKERKLPTTRGSQISQSITEDMLTSKEFASYLAMLSGLLKSSVTSSSVSQFSRNLAVQLTGFGDRLPIQSFESSAAKYEMIERCMNFIEKAHMQFPSVIQIAHAFLTSVEHISEQTTLVQPHLSPLTMKFIAFTSLLPDPPSDDSLFSRLVLIMVDLQEKLLKCILTDTKFETSQMMIPLRKKLATFTRTYLAKSQILRSASEILIPKLAKNFIATIAPLTHIPRLSSHLKQRFRKPSYNEENQLKAIFLDDDGGASQIIEARGDAFHALDTVCYIENEILEGQTPPQLAGLLKHPNQDSEPEILSKEEIDNNINQLLADRSDFNEDRRRNRLEDVSSFLICMFSTHLVFALDDHSTEFSFDCKVISRYGVYEMLRQIVAESPSILTIDQAFSFFGMFFIDKVKRRSRINQLGAIAAAEAISSRAILLCLKLADDEDRLPDSISAAKFRMGYLNWCMQPNTPTAIAALSISNICDLLEEDFKLVEQETFIQSVLDRSMQVLLTFTGGDVPSYVTRRRQESLTGQIDDEDIIQIINTVLTGDLPPHHSSSSSKPNSQHNTKRRQHTIIQISSSIVIFVKHVLHISRLKQTMNQRIEGFVNLFVRILSSLPPQQKSREESAFIAHTLSLFFTLLLTPDIQPTIKDSIWEFVMESMTSSSVYVKQIESNTENKLTNSCSALVVGLIELMNGFALTGQMSQIGKQTINRIMMNLTCVMKSRDTNPSISRSLLGCLQNWIFSFRYFEINCRRENLSDTREFLDNLITALRITAQQGDSQLQLEVQFFLSQLLKSYVSQEEMLTIVRKKKLKKKFGKKEQGNVDQVQDGAAAGDDSIPSDNLSESRSPEVNQKDDYIFTMEIDGEGGKGEIIEKNQQTTKMSEDELALMSRESVYQTIDWHVKNSLRSMKVEDIQMDIAKIERDILKDSQQEWSPNMQANGGQQESGSTAPQNTGFSARLIAQSLKFMKKTPAKEEKDITSLIPRLVTERYLSICVGQDRLLSFLIEPISSQVFAILRDKNGKFAWKLREVDDDIEEIKEKKNSLIDQTEEMQVTEIEFEKDNTTTDRKVLKASSQPALNDFVIIDTSKTSVSKKTGKTEKKSSINSKATPTSASFSGTMTNSLGVPSGQEESISKKASGVSIETLIEQVIYYIHEAIQKSAKKKSSAKEIASMVLSEESDFVENRQSKSKTVGDIMNTELISRNIKQFIREANFLLPTFEPYCILNHTHSNFLPLISSLDQYATSDKVKVGVIYIGEDKKNESEILRTEKGSQSYECFLNRLGQKIRLSQHQGFLGGLSVERDGEYSIYNAFYNCEVIYHIATMMPTKIQQDQNCVSKKRHIGNDFVNIIWNDSQLPFNPSIIPSQFTSAYIIIKPLEESSRCYHVTVIRKTSPSTTSAQQTNEFFPWVDHSIIHEDYLAVLVKIISLNATQALQQIQARQHKNLDEKSLRPFLTRSKLISEFRDEVATEDKGVVADLLQQKTNTAPVTKKNSIVGTSDTQASITARARV